MAPRSSAGSKEVTRVRLSRWSFMRDFLYSDISNLYGIANLPADPDLGIAAGRRLCEEFPGPPRCMGAIACIVLPWFADHLQEGAPGRRWRRGSMITSLTANCNFSRSSAPSTSDGKSTRSERSTALSGLADTSPDRACRTILATTVINIRVFSPVKRRC